MKKHKTRLDFKRAINVSMAIMDVSVSELALETGLQGSAISAMRSGLNNNPTVETINKISAGLKIPVLQFISYGEIDE